MGMRERRNKTRYSRYLVLDVVTDELVTLAQKREHKIQKVYHFPNGYGASVIQGHWTYGGPEGKWEVGVLKFDKRGDWDLNYDTPITSDVLGHLNWEEVLKTLAQIKGLKKK